MIWVKTNNLKFDAKDFHVFDRADFDTEFYCIGTVKVK